MRSSESPGVLPPGGPAVEMRNFGLRPAAATALVGHGCLRDCVSAPLVGMASSSEQAPVLPPSLRARLEAWLLGLLGWGLLAACVAVAASLLTWSAADPSLTRTTVGVTRNALGPIGASFADLAMRLFGLAAVFMVLPLVFWGLQLITRRQLEDARLQLMLASPAVLLLAC